MLTVGGGSTVFVTNGQPAGVPPSYQLGSFTPGYASNNMAIALPTLPLLAPPTFSPISPPTSSPTNSDSEIPPELETSDPTTPPQVEEPIHPPSSRH